MTERKNTVIDKTDLMEAIHMKGPLGRLIASIAMKKLGLDQVNETYRKCMDAEGPEFSRRILEEVGVSCSVEAGQLDFIPMEKPFITISNHAFGSIDGLLLSWLIGSRRPDYKILTNFLLSKIPTLKDTFLPVNPFTDGTSKRNSIGGIRKAKETLLNGGSLGLFPSGEVATYHGHDYVEEIPWAKNIIKLIQTAGVTVVPVYFDGTNSQKFHRLGKIHPILRTARLPKEVFNKSGLCVPVKIGKPVSPSELAEYDNLDDLGKYLRARVYALEAQVDKKTSVPDTGTNTQMEPIVLPFNPQSVLEELEKIKDNMLFETASYQCYLAGYDEIPVIMHEIGRCREESFRATGEGTGKSIDIDEYDRHYQHLFLWDTKQQQIAGAYRLGIGAEIMASHGGAAGFYSSSIFKYKNEFDDILKDSIELGRSFVSRGYQKEAMPLLLLFKGIMFSLLKYPDAIYFIGPVSISSSYPKFYQSLMVKYIMEKHSVEEYKALVEPTTPFEPDFLRVDPDGLLLKKKDTIEKFDRTLVQLSDGEYRVPTLVRKYIKNGAKIICFNVDPLFNYSLDGLILHRITDYPKDELLAMMKDIESDEEKETLLVRFNYSYGTGS
jgi:Putative hemolysin